MIWPRWMPCSAMAAVSFLQRMCRSSALPRAIPMMNLTQRCLHGRTVAAGAIAAAAAALPTVAPAVPSPELKQPAKSKRDAWNHLIATLNDERWPPAARASVGGRLQQRLRAPDQRGRHRERACSPCRASRAEVAAIRAEPGESRDQPGPDRGAIRRAELVALGLPDADR
jgi:hypothetical protein